MNRFVSGFSAVFVSMSMLIPILSNGIPINAESDSGSVTITVYDEETGCDNDGFTYHNDRANSETADIYMKNHYRRTATATFDAKEFFVYVGTYGDDLPQFRYLYPKSDGGYTADKVIWEDAPTDIAYGDIFVADGEISLTKVYPAADNPVYAHAYHYTIDEGVVLNKSGSCADIMEKLDLTVTSQIYDGSSHWSVRYKDEADAEYYYGLSTYRSALEVDPLDCEVGDVYTYAMYNGNLVIPLSKQDSEKSIVMTVEITEINGNTLLVKNTENAGELLTLSVAYLGGIKPTVGMKLEVTYSGEILETYPARFGNIKKVSVVSDDTTTIGDVNGDSSFNVSDVVLLQKWLLAVPNTNLKNRNAADFCKDNVLNVFDLCLMKRALIEKQDSGNKLSKPPIMAINPTLPSVGTIRIPVFAVSFPDCTFSNEDFSEKLQDNFFAPADPDHPSYPLESVSAYYERASYGKLHFTGNVFSYTAEHPIDWYEEDSARSLVSEIIEAYDAQIDYPIYDVNDNQTIDSIAIVLPDAAIEIDNDADGKPDWWPFSTTVTSKEKYDGVNIGRYCIAVYDQNDSSGFITKMAHELGHAMGLPDYYKYTQDETYENDGLIGPAGNELMDEGHGDLSVCSKILLGWLSEDQIQVYTGGTQNFSLTSMQYSPSCIMIPKNPDDGYLSEYFLIEYITEEGNNSQSSGNGIRILHVQAEVSEGRNGMELTYNNYSQNYDKSNQKHRILRLVNQYGYFYPGTKGIQYTNLIDGNIEGFHWYDEEGNLTVDTDIKIEIGGCQPGPDFDPSAFDAGSSLDFENDPSFIKGSTYHITITQSE